MTVNVIIVTFGPGLWSIDALNIEEGSSVVYPCHMLLWTHFAACWIYFIHRHVCAYVTFCSCSPRFNLICLDRFTLGVQRFLPSITLITRFMGPTWAHLGPIGPRWAPCWPHELCYLGRYCICFEIIQCADVMYFHLYAVCAETTCFPVTTEINQLANFNNGSYVNQRWFNGMDIICN